MRELLERLEESMRFARMTKDSILKELGGANTLRHQLGMSAPKTLQGPDGVEFGIRMKGYEGSPAFDACRITRPDEDRPLYDIECLRGGKVAGSERGVPQDRLREAFAKLLRREMNNLAVPAYDD